MLRNYLLVGLRVLRRNPGYAAINVVGLSIGIATCLLVGLFLHEEWTHDRFHENSDDIYRLYRTEHRVRTPLKQSGAVMLPLVNEVRQTIPGVEHISAVAAAEAELAFGTEAAEMEMVFVDPDFLELFSFGGSAEWLRSPDSIVLTRSAALRLLGTAEVTGQSLELTTWSGSQSLVVRGVLPDPPSNSSIRFEAIAPIQVWPGYDRAADNWTSFSATAFAALDPQTDPAAVDAALAALIKDRFSEQIREAIDNGWWEDREDTFAIQLQALSAVHLSPEIDAFNVDVSNPRYAWILLAIGLSVLLIACANFMTLTLGRSVSRTREVGMRKALGANRSQLAGQFWGEAVLLSAAGAAGGLLIAQLALPAFNRLAGESLSLAQGWSAWVPILVLITLITGLVAGSYPALALSGLRPASVLRSSGRKVRGSAFSRGVMIGQFVIAIFLIASTLVMYRQMQFIQQRDLGFDAEAVVLVPMSNAERSVAETYEALAQQLPTIPGVEHFTPASSGFGQSWSRTVMPHEGTNHIVYHSFAGPDYLETLGIQLLEGRNLSSSRESDRDNAVLINQAFADALGWENPIGEFLPRWTDVQVVGVVDDFNYLSLREEVPPMMLHMSAELGSPNYAMVRINTGRISEVMASLEHAWTAVLPGLAFEPEFMDQRMQALYDSERRWQEIVTYAALLAILITCLGLFGVATLALARRRKEIGIRKVLGASIPRLVSLVARDFARLVAVAFIPAAILAWLATNRWLEGFAYRIEPGPGLFAVAGALTLTLALVTISYQAVSTALQDPTRSLRSE